MISIVLLAIIFLVTWATNGFSEEEVQTLSVMAGKVEKNLWEAIKNEEQK